MNTPEILNNANIIVLKIGTALIVEKNGGAVRQGWVDALAADVKRLRDMGKKIVIVSSGAVAMGRNALGISLDMPPSLIPLEKKQACSAAGQFHVFHGFHKAFEVHGIKHAQVLLTMSETENRRMHLNARAALEELLKADIVPIINENDVVSTEEIRFGDNDRLAARVAQMVNADVVVLMSTTDGLYTANPDTDASAAHIPVIEVLGEKHMAMAGEALAGMSTGGMKSKLLAAEAANQSGIHLIICNGMEPGSLGMVIDDGVTRTSLFLGSKERKNAKKRWLGSHMKPKGSVMIDNGALNALKNGKSLLPVGIIGVNGVFERGDAIQVVNEAGAEIAIGIAAYSSEEAEVIRGQNTEKVHELQGYMGRDEMIHRNDLVLKDLPS